MEIAVTRTAAVDVLPRVGGIERELGWRKADHGAIDIVQLLDVEWQATTDQMVTERDGRDSIEKRSRILGQRVKKKSVDDVCDEIDQNLAQSVGLSSLGRISYPCSGNISKGCKPCCVSKVPV